MKAAFFICSFLILITTCDQRVTLKPQVLDILKDFSFVGSGKTALVETKGNIDFSFIATHGLDLVGKPTSIELMTQYIFHYNGAKNNYELAIKDIPARLTKAGFTVLEAPTPQGGFSYPSFSGPLFTVKFTDGRHTGYIFNQVEGRLNGSHSYRNEDYVLVFLKQ